EKSKKSPVTRLTGYETAEAPATVKEENRPPADFDTLLNEALALLPPKCREVFVLSRVNKCTYQQIAETLDISIKTVENQMGKALKLLRGFIRDKQAQAISLLWFISFILGMT
ncbi:MAG: sigma-70 family RNA polymerase sigma factor, partial [Bacteroidetes bacterium]|nr:sigma-70 family RNA polymerase sigma factor [Bacteroidota bacterium]